MYRGYKLAFFDYDRTLFTHSYPTAGEKHLSYEEECFEELAHQKKRHAGDKPVKCMQHLVNLLKENGCVVYILTHECFNLRNEMKLHDAKKYYGIDKLLTTDSSAHKVDMIKAVAKVHNVPLDECLFVDDKMDAIYDACAAGISAIPVINVAQLYEDIE